MSDWDGPSTAGAGAEYDTFDAPLPRFASRGKAFVYVLPCRDRDMVKVGFARDPVRRFMDLHRRFHTFFDLDRGLLVAVDKVSEARAIERALQLRFAEARTHGPLEVREAAGGRTEWFVGIDPAVLTVANALALEKGHEVIEPLRTWLAERLRQDADRLYDWAARVHEAIDEARIYGLSSQRAETALALAIERFDSLGLRVRDYIPSTAADWYELHFHSLG